MLMRGYLRRKLCKAFVYIILISTIAFIITIGKEQNLIKTRTWSSGIKVTEEVKLTYRRTTIGYDVEDGEISKNMPIVTTHKEEQYTEMFKNVPSERQADLDHSNITSIGHSGMENNATFSTTREPEIRHIAFLKVHKAASSTMQNMFFRFGHKRNLTFVFTIHPNYFSRSAQHHLPLVQPKLRTRYDILCNHGIFDYKTYSTLLPNDTMYIGIVRNPLSVFISAVNFYSQESQRLLYLAHIRGNKLRKLIHHPEIYDKGFFSYTKNVMARDFGFPESTDSNIISQKLKELDKIFTLVLIVEHFEESLVLMRRYLNWKMQDILFIPNNVYLDRARAVSTSDLSSSDLQKFKVRNKLDYDLYEFFEMKFWKQFENEPDNIKLEVVHFKNVLEKISSFCNVTKMVDTHGNLTIQKSDWNEEFVTSAEDCAFMKTDELKFIQILRQKQGSEIRDPVRAVYQGRNRFGVDGMRRMGFQPDGMRRMGFQPDGMRRMGFKPDGMRRMGFQQYGMRRMGVQQRRFPRQNMVENRQKGDFGSSRLAARDARRPRRH